MIESKEALVKFREYIDGLRAKYFVTKKGHLKKKLTYSHCSKVTDSYVKFIKSLVGAYVRPIIQGVENVDTTKIYAPDALMNELEGLLTIANPVLTLIIPDPLRKLEGFEDKQTMVFEDGVIIPEE